MDLYKRTKTDKVMWDDSLQIARNLMDYDYIIQLMFKQHKSPLSTIVPQGRMAEMSYESGINVSPSLLELKTSENFRQIGLAHEIREYEISRMSPLTLVFPFVHFIQTIFHKVAHARERYVNESVYQKLIEKNDEETANTRMKEFLMEWLDIRPKERRSFTYEQYVEIFMPFLR